MIEIGLGEGERFLDTQACAPQDHDQTAQPAAVRVVASRAHDRSAHSMGLMAVGFHQPG